MSDEKVKKLVREGYAKIARRENSCCVPSPSCCGGHASSKEISRRIGYTKEELGSVPDEADMGLGCGNPTALATLREGEAVLDLGSGGGLDCFLAARKVGKKGNVVGVDMTAEMIEKARENARSGGFGNVEFRLGEIENLPAGDGRFDVVISNCVINLSPDKSRVFEEAYRVLKPGGRLMVSDIVLLEDLPEFIRDSASAYIGCVAGALRKEVYLEKMRAAGFDRIEIVEQKEYPIEYVVDDPTAQGIVKSLDLKAEDIRTFAHSVTSIQVRAEKPAGS